MRPATARSPLRSVGSGHQPRHPVSAANGSGAAVRDAAPAREARRAGRCAAAAAQRRPAARPAPCAVSPRRPRGRGSRCRSAPSTNRGCSSSAIRNGMLCGRRARDSGATRPGRGVAPPRAFRPRRSAWRSSGRSGPRSRRLPPRRCRRGCRAPAARGRAAAAPPAAGSPARDPRRRRGIRSRARAATAILRPGQRLARGHPQLRVHEVDAGHHLGHRMLHLQARVHLEEVEPRSSPAPSSRNSTVPALR